MAFKPRPFIIIKPKIEKISQEFSETDWKQIEPGSRQWLTYWKDHPEHQEEMLKFKKEK
jgi:hypothetical protein